MCNSCRPSSRGSYWMLTVPSRLSLIKALSIWPLGILTSPAIIFIWFIVIYFYLISFHRRSITCYLTTGCWQRDIVQFNRSILRLACAPLACLFSGVSLSSRKGKTNKQSFNTNSLNVKTNIRISAPKKKTKEKLRRAFSTSCFCSIFLIGSLCTVVYLWTRTTPLGVWENGSKYRSFVNNK